MNKEQFVSIILENAQELSILNIEENYFNNFIRDKDKRLYQIELYKRIKDSEIFTGYIFYLEDKELSLWCVDSVLDMTRRRNKVIQTKPVMEWKKFIKIPPHIYYSNS